MKTRIRIVGGVALFVLAALGVPPRMAPAQITFSPEDPYDAAAVSGGMQEWETELGGTSCKGECPGSRWGCCSSMAF